jgi:two-component system chemotaxis response regulator CheV
MTSNTLASVDQRTKMAGHNKFDMLIFKINNQSFGINVFKIREILTYKEVTKIPHCHPSVLGMAYIRGEAMAVIDTRMAIGMGNMGKPSNETRIIVTEYNLSTQAIIVDSVENIHHTNWNETSPPPSSIGKNSFLTAVAEVNKEIVGILDVERILSDIRQDDDQSDSMIEKIHVGQSKKIMVVDDSEVARRQVIRCLEKLGFTNDCFANGKEALDHLKNMVEKGINPSEYYSMMITDIEMPVMDGYTLVAEARTDKNLKDITIVMHSSLSGVFNQALSESVGADYLLPKYNAKELQDLVMSISSCTENKAA